MNITMKSVVGAALLAAFGVSSAAEYLENGAGPYNLAVDGPITDTFRGPAALQAGDCSLNCTLTVEGSVSEAGGLVTLDVTNAYSTGSFFLCSLVSFSGFTWTGSAPASGAGSPLPTTFNSGLDVPFTIGTVTVNSPCGNCSGDVDVVFNNNNSGLSYFRFNDTLSPNCSVNSSGSHLVSVSGNDYDIRQ